MIKNFPNTGFSLVVQELTLCIKTKIADISEYLLGFGMGYDDVVVHGNLDEYKFVAFYTK